MTSGYSLHGSIKIVKLVLNSLSVFPPYPFSASHICMILAWCELHIYSFPKSIHDLDQLLVQEDLVMKNLRTHQSCTVRWNSEPLSVLENHTSANSKHIDVCPSCASASVSHFWFSGHKLLLDANQWQAIVQQL